MNRETARFSATTTKSTETCCPAQAPRFDVETAANGKEALKLVENYDLILWTSCCPSCGLEVLGSCGRPIANELPTSWRRPKIEVKTSWRLELGANVHEAHRLSRALARVQSHLRQKFSSNPKGPKLAEAAPHEIGTGAVLADKYHLEELLGRALSANVYKAMHATKRPVAIKVLQTDGPDLGSACTVSNATSWRAG